MKNDTEKKLPARYDENIAGDFYVERGVCINCYAPEAEAPGLIDHTKTIHSHCYFKKQPEAPEEITQAIVAMEVSCINGIRYGGTDKIILQRLFDLGLENECDLMPLEELKKNSKTNVSFFYDNSIEALYGFLLKEMGIPLMDAGKSIINFYWNEKDFFEFIHRQSWGHSGVHYGSNYSNGVWIIELKKEQGCLIKTLIKAAEKLNTILLSNEEVSNIIWYSDDAAKTV